jgi:hypothetical protein
MSIGRTILALVIAVSVAMLPITGTVGAFAAPHDMSSASEMSASDMSAAGVSMPDASMPDAMHDCCPAQANPCDKDGQDCAFMTTCALKCFNLSTPSFADPASFPTGPAPLSLLASARLDAQSASPPLPPPRS